MKYEEIARYYDQTHTDLTEDVGYVLTLAARSPGPILELGCGTGRLTIPMARAGYEVTGLDRSPAMLMKAEAKREIEPTEVQNRLTFINSDMTSFRLEGQFGLVAISHNTFLHLETNEKARTLESVRAHLHPDGELYIDMIGPNAVAQTADDPTVTLERTFADPDTDELVLQLASSSVDRKRQILRIVWIYDAAPVSGGPVKRTVVPAEYHYLYPHQMELLLEQAGFFLEGLYGGYGEAAYGEDSERLIVLASRVH